MGGLLFNVKPHINLLRKIVYSFNGGRGKPLNLFPAFVPETITIPNGFKPKKTNQKGYPMYNYISKKGFPRSLREYMPYNFRVLCNNSSQKIDKLVDNGQLIKIDSLYSAQQIFSDKNIYKYLKETVITQELIEKLASGIDFSQAISQDNKVLEESILTLLRLFTIELKE